MENNQAMHIDVFLKRVKFYSTDDKNAFFNWLYAMPDIVDVTGIKDSIRLTAKTPLSQESLCRLVALCRRYHIEPEALAALVTPDSAEYFKSCWEGFSICVYPARGIK